MHLLLLILINTAHQVEKVRQINRNHWQRVILLINTWNFLLFSSLFWVRFFYNFSTKRIFVSYWLRTKIPIWLEKNVQKSRAKIDYNRTKQRPKAKWFDLSRSKYSFKNSIAADWWKNADWQQLAAKINACDRCAVKMPLIWRFTEIVWPKTETFTLLMVQIVIKR